MKSALLVAVMLASVSASAQQRYNIPFEKNQINVINSQERLELDFPSNISRGYVVIGESTINKPYCDYLKVEMPKTTDLAKLELTTRKFGKNNMHVELLGYDWVDDKVKDTLNNYFLKAGLDLNSKDLLEMNASRDFEVEIKTLPDALSNKLGTDNLKNDIESQLINNNSLKDIKFFIKANDLACDLLNKKASIVVRIKLHSKEYFSKPLLSVQQINSVISLTRQKSNKYIDDMESFISSPSIEDKNLALVSALALSLKEVVKMEPTDIGTKNYSELASQIINYQTGSVRTLRNEELQSLASKIGVVDNSDNKKQITITIQ